MGINGLLPVLKSISEPVHVRTYRGKKVAIDAYSWLHKGAYCCSRELLEGTYTEKFVWYCLKKIEMLQSHGVQPVVVFDGCNMPMKAGEETSRRKAREEARSQAEQLLLAGNVKAAEERYQRAVDVSPEMAKQFIEALRARSVEYIVAPYEADAQLAYLARRGDVWAVFTEDSDLLAYGCPRVLFKLDKDGYGVEVLLQNLPQNKGVALESFTANMFLEMCVMAGCDFLKGISGIGMKKAHMHIKQHRSWLKAVQSLRSSGSAVPSTYEDQFQKALWVFRHQRVFCPHKRQMVHLNPLPAGGIGAADVEFSPAIPEGSDAIKLDFLGPLMSSELAAGIACGDIDPSSCKPYCVQSIFGHCKNPPPYIARILKSGLPSAGQAPIFQSATDKVLDFSQMISGKQAVQDRQLPLTGSGKPKTQASSKESDCSKLKNSIFKFLTPKGRTPLGEVAKGKTPQSAGMPCSSAAVSEVPCQPLYGGSQCQAGQLVPPLEKRASCVAVSAPQQSLPQLAEVGVNKNNPFACRLQPKPSNMHGNDFQHLSLEECESGHPSSPITTTNAIGKSVGQGLDKQREVMACSVEVRIPTGGAHAMLYSHGVHQDRVAARQSSSDGHWRRHAPTQGQQMRPPAEDSDMLEIRAPASSCRKLCMTAAGGTDVKGSLVSFLQDTSPESLHYTQTGKLISHLECQDRQQHGENELVSALFCSAAKGGVRNTALRHQDRQSLQDMKLQYDGPSATKLAHGIQGPLDWAHIRPRDVRDPTALEEPTSGPSLSFASQMCAPQHACSNTSYPDVVTSTSRGIQLDEAVTHQGGHQSDSRCRSNQISSEGLADECDVDSSSRLVFDCEKADEHDQVVILTQKPYMVAITVPRAPAPGKLGPLTDVTTAACFDAESDPAMQRVRRCVERKKGIAGTDFSHLMPRHRALDRAASVVEDCHVDSCQPSAAVQCFESMPEISHSTTRGNECLDGTWRSVNRKKRVVSPTAGDRGRSKICARSPLTPIKVAQQPPASQLQSPTQRYANLEKQPGPMHEERRLQSRGFHGVDHIQACCEIAKDVVSRMEHRKACGLPQQTLQVRAGQRESALE